MINESKNSNFLNYDVSKKGILEKIDKSNFLGLGLENKDTSRLELFLFAMALGMDTMPRDLHSKTSLVRREYVRTNQEALLYSAYIKYEKVNQDFEKIDDQSKVFGLAERYANTGFDIIEDMIDNKSEKEAVLELIGELDEAYEKLFESNK